MFYYTAEWTIDNQTVKTYNFNNFLEISFAKRWNQRTAGILAVS
jgi:hypothetical protein